VIASGSGGAKMAKKKHTTCGGQIRKHNAEREGVKKPGVSTYTLSWGRKTGGKEKKGGLARSNFQRGGEPQRGGFKEVVKRDIG